MGTMRAPSNLSERPEATPTQEPERSPAIFTHDGSFRVCVSVCARSDVHLYALQCDDLLSVGVSSL